MTAAEPTSGGPERALGTLSTTVCDDAVERSAALATAHMQRGLALMEGRGKTASAPAALAHFNAALEIRRALPGSDPHAVYALAASWMNRAEALLALGDAASLTKAIESLDAAVEILETIPLTADPRFPRRLAIALQNRAFARGRLRRDMWTMIPDLFRALDLIGPAADADDLRLSAAIWVNVGVAQLHEPAEDAWRRAVTSARQALELVGAREESDERLAAVGLQARHLICRAAAQCLALTNTTAVTPDVHNATDAADEALILISLWEKRGVSAFRRLAADLYEFGRRVYSIYQPQFLDEFDSDHSDWHAALTLRPIAVGRQVRSEPPIPVAGADA